MTDAKTTILAATTACIARTGVRGLRVGDVATEAGVSPGLLYYHFTDRAGLLAATLDYINARAGDHRAAASTERLLLAELDDSSEVRRDSIAWNELRASAIFDPHLAKAIGGTTRSWNDAIAASLPSGPSGYAAVDRAEILTTLVEGLAARWLSGAMTADRARGLLSAAMSALGATSAASTTPSKGTP